MSDKLSELEQEHISDIVSGIGAPSVSSAKANIQPTLAETYPLTAAYLSGIVKPIAGISQFLGINDPAQYVHNIEEEAKSTGRTGVGGAQFTGELAGLLTGGELTPEIKALTKAKPLTTGAVTGAATSAVMPTEVKEGEDYSDFLKHKATDIAEGAALGGAFGKGAQLLFSPAMGQRLQTLKDMGMTRFTPAQLLADVPLIGNALLKSEQAISSQPVIGDIMATGRNRVLEDFNRAVANHVLHPMGESIDEETTAGHKIASDVYDKITNAYNDISGRLEINGRKKIDIPGSKTKQTALATLNDALNEATSELDVPSAKLVNDTYKKLVVNKFDSNLKMSGEQFRKAESALGNLAYSAYGKSNYDLMNAYRTIQSSLREVLAKTNPDKAEELTGIHESFKRWLRLEKATEKAGKSEGIFSPEQLSTAVNTLGGKASARGEALMQDQSKAALSLLGKKVNNSGTADRLLLEKMGSGLAAMMHYLPIPQTIAAFAAYSPKGMEMLTKLATERPEFMKAIAPELQTTLSTGAGATVNNYAKGGLLDKFKKKSKKLAQGGIIRLAEGGKPSLDDAVLSFERAKQNIADTYDTAKDLISNPTPYLNKFKQIPGIINDPAEPISHYIKGDISGGIARANEALSERSPEEIASGFAQPGAMGIVGSIENVGAKLTSPLSKTIASHKLESMPANQWSSWLQSNAPKAAKKEAEAVNLNSLLESNKNAKLTKADIINHINAESPKVETKILGNTEALNPESPYATPEVLDVLKRHQGQADNAAQLALSNDYDAYQSLVKKHPGLVDQERWEDKVVNDIMGGKYHPTRYENWQLPGGENYKEMLVKLPPKVMPFDEYIKHVPESIRSPEAREHLNNIYNEYVQDPGSDFSKFENYKSKHWDDPNIIAHLRMNDRITPEGKKMLHLEELQSDWGQQGKKYGFDYNHLTHEDINAQLIQPNVPEGHDPNVYGPHWEIRNKHTGELIGRDRGDKSYDEAVNPMLDWYNETNRSSSIPSAPYVTDTKDWTALGFKQALKHAAENNYEGITWTNGEQQAERYDLSKHLHSVHLTPMLDEPGIFHLKAYDHDDNRVIDKHVTEDHLDEYIGKDLANKLLKAPKDSSVLKEERKLEGLDLKVGGEGMKGYYDQILPQTVNDVMKQIGSKEKVQPIDVSLGDPIYALRNKTTGNSIGGGYSLWQAKQAVAQNPNREMYLVYGGHSPQMGIKLTPELKQKILKEGIPKFKRGGLLAKFQK